MKVLLMQDVAKVGKKYEVKEVASGFARNLLIPSGKAVDPNTFSADKLKALQAKHLHAAEHRLAELKTAFEAMTDKQVVLSGKANEDGHLFAGLGKDVLASAIKDQLGLELEPSEIHLGHALKSTGSHEVEIGEGNKLTVVVEAE